MNPPDKPLSHEDRNRLILLRTLSAVSWLWCLWSGLLGLLGWGAGSVYGAWMTGHAALLGLAGWGLWRPRRWGWAAALLAAAGAVAFAVRDARRPNWEAVALDAVYPLLALAILGLVSRPRGR